MKHEKLLPSLRLNLLCISVVYIAIGAVLLIFPQISLDTLCAALGVAAIILGAVSAAVYFIRCCYLNPDHYGFAGGIAAIVFGLFAVIRTADFSKAFAQILALCMIADCIIKLQFSMDLLRLCNKLWWGLLAVSCIMAALAFLTLIEPFPSPGSNAIFTYSVLIADGIINILAAALLAYALKKYQQFPVSSSEDKPSDDD